jgi:hypothetical protein
MNECCAVVQRIEFKLGASLFKMQINSPSVLAELQAVFDRYETAVIHNQINVLDELFWNDSLTIRYGVAENLYGYDAIQAFRASRSKGVQRTLSHTVITTFGNDFATANTEYQSDGNVRQGRQSQTWMRQPEGWRIVSAHVSWSA